MCSFFFLCGFTPENNDQFFIPILSLIIRSEWVLCKTKLKIWLFTALSPSMQIINHSDVKSIVCSFLIFGTWLNDVRFVLVQRAECEETVCPVTAEAWLRAASSESLRFGAKTNNCPFQFKRSQQAHSDYGSDNHKNSLFYPYASVFRATVDSSCLLLNPTCLL